MDLNKPYKIEFEYQHSKKGIEKYVVGCFVILLY